MSNAKLSSSDYEGQPGSGQRPAARYRSVSTTEPDFEQPDSGGFSGTCENLSLSDWIQLVQMGRRDAIIGIKRHDGRKALLWCRDGDVIDAWCDGTLGEDAVYRALTWTGGQVSVTFAPFEHPRRIEMGTPALLLNAAYHKDSVVRHRDSLVRELKPVSPPLTPSLSFAPPATTPMTAQADGDEPSVTPSAVEPEGAPETERAATTEDPPLSEDAGGRAPQSSLAPATIAESLAPSKARRASKRVWVASGAALLLPLLAFTLSFRAPPRAQSAAKVGVAAARVPQSEVITTEEQVITPNEQAAARERTANPTRNEAVTAKPPKAPAARDTARPTRAAPATPHRALASAPTQTPSATASAAKSAAKKAAPQLADERTPRVQVIDEPSSKIEVIE